MYFHVYACWPMLGGSGSKSIRAAQRILLSIGNQEQAVLLRQEAIHEIKRRGIGSKHDFSISWWRG